MSTISRLPGPVADLWEWQFDGSCRRENPDVFFHPDRERGSLRRSRDSTAKAVCRGCPVLQTCRRHALQVREPYGVWGGLTEHEREATYGPSAVRRPRAGSPAAWARREHTGSVRSVRAEPARGSAGAPADHVVEGISCRESPGG